MELDAILTAVNAVGFPIVACVAMFYRMNKSDEKHSEEIKQLSDALQNNTVAMTKLAERIGSVDRTQDDG